MEKTRFLIAVSASLGLFGLGYLTGRTAEGTNTREDRIPPPSVRRPGVRDDQRPPDKLTAKKTAREAPNPEKALSRRIINMVGVGEFSISGVSIRNDSLLPGDKVKEFFDLTDEQFETMKRVGQDRLRRKQDREYSLAKFSAVSESGMTFDLPADPDFANQEREGFVEEIRQNFGSDVAEMLKTSIGQAYRGLESPRHVRYTLTPREVGALPDAPPEIRAAYEKMYDYKISVNQNEDGSYMTDSRGGMLPVGGSESGTLSLSDSSEEAFRPRFHDFWEREKNRR